MVEKYYNEDGELGVLYSPGFGAGWSTWHDKYEDDYEEHRIAYDKRIIEYWLNNKPSSEDMSKFLESIGYKNVYMGGYEDLSIAWIPRGTMFYIDEYDGFESIKTPSSCGMTMA